MVYHFLSCLQLVAEVGFMCRFSSGGDDINIKFLHLALSLAVSQKI